jgi:chemotaxis protein MotA
MVGFTMAGGHLAALLHPSELVTIGGAAMGSLIMMSPGRVLMGLLKGIGQCVKGTPYNRRAYEDVFQVLYELLRLARRDGLIVLEPHLTSPDQSSIFIKYPRILDDHHVTGFICGALTPIIEGAIKPDQLPGLLEAEIRALEKEHEAPHGVLAKTADAMPGFGIVAAVLGIVVTMSSIDGPVAEVGEKVGAALVGTFLGVLLSYGFFGPLSVRLEFLSAAEVAFFRTMAAVIEGLAADLPPKVALELARRSVSIEYRPTRERLDELFVEAESATGGKKDGG